MKPTKKCRPSAAAALLLLAACAVDTPEGANVSVRLLESPAGPGSGEPFLAERDGRVYLSWLERVEGELHELRFASWGGSEGGWSEARTVEASERFFVNWADFPSVVPGDAVLWAHWLERGSAGGYDYGVRVVRSSDGGATWSEPWTPHVDDSPTEHGFVAMMPIDGGMGLVWLDGRKYADAPDGQPATQEMTLRFRHVSADGTPAPETLLDGRVCDCCQTDAAMTADGPVVVYRDRSPAEVRDIYVTRLRNGAWSEGEPVHQDGWEIAGCPVNGPAVAAFGTRVAVAWFAAPGDVARAKVAFSDDGGRTWGPPVVVDDGDPAGRVDIVYVGEDEALVSWLERTGGEGAEVRVRRVRPDGTTGPAATVTGSSAARASGFPRMVREPDGGVLLAWTDVSEPESRVLVARVEGVP